MSILRQVFHQAGPYKTCETGPGSEGSHLSENLLIPRMSSPWKDVTMIDGEDEWDHYMEFFHVEPEDDECNTFDGGKRRKDEEDEEDIFETEATAGAVNNDCSDDAMADNAITI